LVFEKPLETKFLKLQKYKSTQNLMLFLMTQTAGRYDVVVLQYE
jgi:hypothetical protein